MENIKLTFIVLLVAYTSRSFAQTSKDVTENHIKALGGEENIRRILNIELSGKQVYDSILKVTPYKVYKQRPNLILTENIDDTDTTYSCFDGTKYCFGSKPERETISRLSKMRSVIPVKQPIDGFINDYINVSDKAALLKRDTINNRIYFKLSHHYDTMTRYFYIDALTYQIHKQVDILSSDVRNESMFSDYITVDGVKFPRKIEVISYTNDIIVFRYRYVFDDVQTNRNLTSDLFICR